MAEGPPTLRRELRFLHRGPKGGESVFIEDPLGGGFLETDQDTAAFARLLNGKRTPEEARRRLLADRPGATLGEAEIQPVVEELRKHALLYGDKAGVPAGAGGRRFGPISQRLRLGVGDRAFAVCARWLRWLYSPAAAIAWVALMAVALAELGSHWSVFYRELGALFTMDMVLVFWLAWVVSKAWHEFQHGVVARLHNVEVREYGLLFMLFLPLGAYVDVTGAWRLESRWRRLHITAAGIIGELALGAVAILLWSRAPEGDWRAFLQALVMATVVSSLIFNANPLMRYDGYYALTDLLGIPNLYTRALAATRGVTMHLLTGLPPKEREGLAIVIYGWLAHAWRLLIAVTLSIAAAHLAFGFGLVLAAVACWTMLVAPLGRFAKAIWDIGPSARRTAGLRLVLCAGAIAALWFLPVPTWISAPGVVEYHDRFQLRAASSGQVTMVGFDEGSRIAAGDMVASLTNMALETDHRKLVARQALTQIQLDQTRNGGDATAFEGKRELLETARQELAESERQLGRLSIVAPRSGIIYGKDLRALRGTWVQRGDLIGEIGEPGQFEARVWLLPEDAALLTAVASGLTFRQTGFGSAPVPVHLERIEPAAAVELPPAAITAEGGGPLAINVGGKERRLSEARFASTFLPEGAATDWYPGAPGRLVSDVTWRPAGTIIRGWLDRSDLRDPSRWALSKE